MGSVDQRDHHLPVTTDTLLADAAAIAAAERVAEDIPVLVTPPLWPGYSLPHCSLGGTLTLVLDTMVDVLDEVADGALDRATAATLRSSTVRSRSWGAPLIRRSMHDQRRPARLQVRSSAVSGRLL